MTTSPTGLVPLPTAKTRGPAQIVRPAWVRLFRFGLWTLLTVGAPAVLIIMVDQARDASRAMSTGGVWAYRLSIAVIAAAGCALVAWRMLRILQERVLHRADAPDADPTQTDWFVRHYPRLLGFVPLGGILVQYAILAIESVVGRLGVWPEIAIGGLALVSAAVATQSLLNVTRARARRKAGTGNDPAPIGRAEIRRIYVLMFVGSGLPVAGALLTAWLGGDASGVDSAVILGTNALAAWVLLATLYTLATLRREVADQGFIGRLIEHPKTFRRFVAPLMILLAIGSTFPRYAPLLGPIAILLLGGGCWCVVGNWLILLGLETHIRRWHGVPILSTLLTVTLAVGLTFPSSGNQARMIARSTPPTSMSIGVAHERYRASLDPNEPLVIVAAEGGGIYAAYHAATLLGRLEDHARSRNETPPSERIFAMSGVSGGSVGLGVYAALLHADRSNPIESFEAAAQDLLKADLLSPVLAAGLGRDLLPLPFAQLDRSRALEGTLVSAWASAVPKDTSDPLLRPVDLIGPTDEAWSPLVILNTTRVGAGSPYYISELDLGAPPSDDALGIPTRLVPADQATRDLPLVTAMFLSARFPVVTSSGRLEFNDWDGVRTDDSFVDGGYFENVGCASAFRLITQLRAAGLEQGREIRVLVIRADGSLERRRFTAGDLLAPVSALANTRSAHGRGYRRRLEQLPRTLVRSDATLALNDASIPIPLGWLLSTKTREIIDSQRPAHVPLIWDWMLGRTAP